MALEIVRVPVLSDNYAWLLHDQATGHTAALDPGEAQPLLDAASERAWTISQVWNTHWHPDHVGGNAAIGAPVTGPEAERAKIGAMEHGVAEGDTVRLGESVATVMTVPGHTQGHVAFHFVEDAVIFTGDTLFAMGCGRLFEGTPADMWGNMERYAALPDATRVYCGHEYTLSNAKFAAHAEPENGEIATRLAAVTAMRTRGEPTVPTTIGEERATNPFLRAGSAEELGRLRAEKDAF